MTISIWRYSHLALAISSFLFLALASVTGIILAFEPVAQKVQPYRSDNFNKLTLADAIPAVKKNYTDITELLVDDNDFVIVKAIDLNDEAVEVYVDPATGKQSGILPKKNEFFQWVTNLHRSLFLHETGRFIIGLAAFLLMLIAISGTMLIIQRQRGVKRFFCKIVKDGSAQYYHVVLGRLSLIVIIIIALSGTILSLQRFGLLPEIKISRTIDFEKLNTTPVLKPGAFAIFQATPLSEVKRIEFPFSEDVEDYYTLQLKDRELTVNQVTGEVITQELYPFTALLTRWSMNLHTGRTSAVWAIILAIACINILFFIWSGFVMTLKRRKGRTTNKYKAAESNIIILVGSENGNSFRFAKAVQQQLLMQGQKCFVTQLNEYTLFPKAQHIIVMTATYGLGDAPSNAGKFESLLEKFPQLQPVQFSVLGFGSHAYPDFCKYAFEVNNLLSTQSWAEPLIEIHTVNDRSPQEFALWAELWSQKAGIEMQLPAEAFTATTTGLHSFTLVEKETVDTEEENFLLKLEAPPGLAFNSGDLLAVYPANDHRERQYSIGKVNGRIQLSVKLHAGGLGSSFLYALETGSQVNGTVIANPHFYFPAKSAAVIMISNGTGIAPFLGMIEENAGRIHCRLYCGFKNSASFRLYKSGLEEAVQQKKLQQLQVAFSREEEQQYVSHLLQKDADSIAAALAGQAVIMICGSLSMQKDVIALLDTICKEKNNKPVSYYQSHGQVLMDCY